MGLLDKLFDPGKKTRRAGEAMAREAQFQNFNVAGPGGTAGFDARTGNLNLQLSPEMAAMQRGIYGQAAAQPGMGQDAYNAFAQYGQQAMGGLMGGAFGGGQFQAQPFSQFAMGGGPAQLPQFQQQMGPQQFQSQMFNMPGQTNFGVNPGQAYQANLPQFQQMNPFQGRAFDPNRGMARQLNAAAMGLLPGASQDIAGAEQDALARLRAQAAPQERQAMSDLNERLYGTGQGAVTGNANVELGGGRLAQAFGRGLGQADLDRQVQAQGMAIQRRGAEQAALSGLLGESRGTQGLSEQLQQGLFGRQLGMGQFGLEQQGQQFGQALGAAQFGAGENQAQFGRNLGAAQFALGQSGQNFSNALAGAGFNEQQLQNMFGRQLQGAQFSAGEQARGFSQAMAGAGLQDQLRQSAFNRQLGAGQFGMGVNQQNFAQNLAQGQFQNAAAGQGFDMAQQLFAGQQGMGSQNIQNQIALMGLGLGMNALPQQLFGLGLNAQTARSNAALGGAQGMFQAAASTPNPFLDLAVGAMGMAGQFKGASDRRLKENLQELMVDDATGLMIYAWDWNDEGKRIAGKQPPIGLIAQDVQAKYPEAVSEHRGYLHIDYRKLIELTGV